MQIPLMPAVLLGNQRPHAHTHLLLMPAALRHHHHHARSAHLLRQRTPPPPRCPAPPRGTCRTRHRTTPYTRPPLLHWCCYHHRRCCLTLRVRTGPTSPRCRPPHATRARAGRTAARGAAGAAPALLPWPVFQLLLLAPGRPPPPAAAPPAMRKGPPCCPAVTGEQSATSHTYGAAVR